MSIGSYGTKKNNLLFNPTKPLEFQQSQVTPNKIPHKSQAKGTVGAHDIHAWPRSLSGTNINVQRSVRVTFFTSQDEAEKMESFSKNEQKGNRNKMNGFKMDWQNQLYIYICMNSNFSLNNLFAPVLITTQDQQKIQKYIIKKSAASIRKMLIDYS